MSDGNTLIGNALIGHGLEQGEMSTQEDAFLEEEVLAHEEEHIMSEEVTSEDDEKMERQMLTVALMNSVVETSKKSADGDSKHRYSLRKRRRRPSREISIEPVAHVPLVKVESPSSKRQEPHMAQKKPPYDPTASEHGIIDEFEPTSSVPLQPSPRQQIIPKAKVKVKVEAAPACTIAVPSTPLPVPLTASNLPHPSTLPPALQPPSRASLQAMPPPRATTAAPTKAARPKLAKAKPARLVPAVRVTVLSTPLTPNPAAIGVPNPLSNPLPPSQPVPVGNHKQGPCAPTSFQVGTKITVPCPLLPSTFESKVDVETPMSRPGADLGAEKKKVTIDLPYQQRGRIFSMDLDPSSLDFSILESVDAAIPIAASADLPLLHGGARDRAFSFECFAFGINADEPLPPLAEHTAAENEASLAQQQDFVSLPRPRGDSIIFDPSSFQEGGIHEERALTSREERGMSVDLQAGGITPPYSDDPEQRLLSEGSPPPQAVTSTSTYTAPPLMETGYPNPPTAPAHPTMPDSAPSEALVIHPGAALHHEAMSHEHYPPHLHHSPDPCHHSANQDSCAEVSSIPPLLSGAVSIISSCSSSTTLQMELLNKGGRIGIYLPDARRERIARFHAKRKMRIWRKRIKYDCRKKLADSRPRIKGRFVKRQDMD